LNRIRTLPTKRSGNILPGIFAGAPATQTFYARFALLKQRSTLGSSNSSQRKIVQRLLCAEEHATTNVCLVEAICAFGKINFQKNAIMSQTTSQIA